MQSLRGYFTFCRDYYRWTGYSSNLPNAGCRSKEDTSSLFSYSFDGPVMTFDPVSTGNPGWEESLAAYNEFCSQHEGRPLFNQAGWLACAQVGKAFGDRLKTFEGYRQRFDPTDRLLNEYFRQLLQQHPAIDCILGAMSENTYLSNRITHSAQERRPLTSHRSLAKYRSMADAVPTAA